MEIRSISNIIKEKFQYEKCAQDFFTERPNDALNLYNALYSDFVTYSRSSALEILALNKQLTYTMHMTNQQIRMLEHQIHFLENCASDTKQLYQKQVELLETNHKETKKTLERELLRAQGSQFADSCFL